MDNESYDFNKLLGVQADRGPETTVRLSGLYG